MYQYKRLKTTGASQQPVKAPFHDKNSQQTRARKECPYPDNGHQWKPQTLTSYLMGERMNASTLRTGIRRSSVFPLLLHIVLENLVKTIRQENKVKGIQIVKEEVKFCYCSERENMYRKS